MSELQAFVEHIQEWHENQTGQLQKIIDTPQGTPIHLGEGPDAIVLDGDKAAGFRAGVVAALSFLGKLPFTVDDEDPCAECGQKDHGQTGEHPCTACGVPTEHDPS